MKIIPQSYEILTPISENGLQELKLIEQVGRTCYKSESKISPDGNSAKQFVKRLIESGHESVLEHSMLSVRFVTNRAIANEIVRHRNCAFAQESTRYCDYSKDRFDGLTFISSEIDGVEDTGTHYMVVEWLYKHFTQKESMPPQIARDILPLSLKTELVMTTNYREWRYFLKTRTAKDAHPHIRELLLPLVSELQEKIPVIFDDVKEL